MKRRQKNHLACRIICRISIFRNLSSYYNRRREPTETLDYLLRSAAANAIKKLSWKSISSLCHTLLSTAELNLRGQPVGNFSQPREMDNGRHEPNFSRLGILGLGYYTPGCDVP